MIRAVAVALARPVALVIIAFALARPTAPVLAGSLEAPPPGISPTTTSLRDVLVQSARAFGTPSPSMAARLRNWSISAFGLSGTSSQAFDGDDERISITLGPFTESHGTYHGERWRQNPNGLTVRLAGIHQRDLIDQRALDEAAKTGEAEGVRLLGRVISPTPAYVVQVDPAGGRREWLYYDLTSARLVRKEAVVVDRRVITTFDDFRKTDGLDEPWHYRIDDGRPANIEDWRQVSERSMPAIPASELAPPAQKTRMVEFPAGLAMVRLPARIEHGRIIVRLDVAGRGLDFLLDSGASGIAFDRAVVSALHLPSYGVSTATTAGSYQESSTIVPEIRIGDLLMHSVVVSILPFQSNVASGTKAVGLLGFDFIDGVVLRVDYEHGTVDAFLPSSPPALTNAIELPAALDDGVPDVRAAIAGAAGDHFILDTGATSSVVFSQFADAFPNALRDQGLGVRLMHEHPFQFAGGVGGTLHVVPTQVKSYGTGNAQFTDFLAYVVRGNRAYEGEDEDGLIGYAYLKYFTLYLDYSRSRVLLVRNGLAYQPPDFTPPEPVLP